MKIEQIKDMVKEKYGQVARDSSSCCGPVSSCCGENPSDTISKNMGYSDTDLKSVPDGANLGLGCGNPIALASLKEGEVVLDLGSGAGFDAFLAARQVGDTGKVIGVDMTADMLSKARENAEKGGYNNVEFRLGEIEYLPVADNTVDIIISNCVINLSPEKEKVFNEAARVLKPGGRLMISDIVLEEKLPEEVRYSVSAYVGCVSGADLKQEYLDKIKSAGFDNVEILDETSPDFGISSNDPIVREIAEKMKMKSEDVAEFAAKNVKSIKVKAIKS